jgi:prepilin-type N-terminal cleavage/methylation domain-containing protein
MTRSRSGFSMVEAVVALAIASVWRSISARILADSA